MRLAVSAHACDHGDGGAEDMNPALCHAHCTDQQTTGAADAPALALAAGARLLVVLPDPAEPTIPPRGFDFASRRTDPPPLLAYCVMRS